MGVIMSRLLIDRSPLHIDKRPYAKIVAGPISDKAWYINFEYLALLDTGFSGWIILPNKMKHQIGPKPFENRLSNLRSPRFISYTGSNQSTLTSESYSTIRIRIQTATMGQEIHYEEFSPDIVSFSDKDYAIIGSQFFMKYSLQLTVIYLKRLYSLEQL